MRRNKRILAQNEQHLEGKLEVAHHECFEIGSPPLRKTVAYLPLIINSVRRVELQRISRWRKAVVEAPL